MQLLLFSMLVWAGEHKPLCEKVREADLVMEITFTQKGHYPQREKDNEWGPPESELTKTAKTGIVTTVFKGDIQKGDPWLPGYGHHFDPGPSSAMAWSAFFARKHFSQIYFLRQEADRHATTGWAEESADCGPDSNHRSWCKGYPDYKNRILACLKE